MESESIPASTVTGAEDTSKDIPPQQKPDVHKIHPVVPVALHVPEFEDGIGYRPVLSEHDPDFDFLYEVYVQSFPEEERRNKEQLLEEMTRPEACVGLITIEGERVGLFIYWELEDFIYAGHFAIHEDFRGDGVGFSFLSQFLRWAYKPVILEVERPENKISRKRIAFYERLGIKLFVCDYLQPSYEEGKAAVPLYLMEAPAHTQGPKENANYMLPEAYPEIKSALYKHIYANCDIK